MSSKDYTLFEYSFNGEQVVSAIHWRDVGSFLREHPDAKRKAN
jgi:mannose-1-phosphate guanylyltransferase